MNKRVVLLSAVIADVTSIHCILQMVLRFHDGGSCHRKESRKIRGTEPSEPLNDLTDGGRDGFFELIAKPKVVRKGPRRGQPVDSELERVCRLPRSEISKGADTHRMAREARPLPSRLLPKTARSTTR